MENNSTAQFNMLRQNQQNSINQEEKFEQRENDLEIQTSQKNESFNQNQNNQKQIQVLQSPKIDYEKEVSCLQKIELSTENQKIQLEINLENSKVDYQNSQSSYKMEQENKINVTHQSNQSCLSEIEESSQSLKFQIVQNQKRQVVVSKSQSLDIKCQLLDIINKKIIKNQKSNCQFNQQIIIDFENNEQKSIQKELEVTPDCIQQKVREINQEIQIGKLVFDEWVENDEQIIKNSSFTQTITTQKDVLNEPSYHSLVSNQTTLIHPTATCNLYHLANQLQNQESLNEKHDFQVESSKMSNSQIQIVNNKQNNSQFLHHHQNQKSMHLPIIPKQPIPNIYKKHQYAQSISGSLSNLKNTGYLFFQRSHTDFRVQKIDPNIDHITNSSHQSLNFENAIHPVIPLQEYEKMKEEQEQKFISLQKQNYQLEKENALLKQSLDQKELEDQSNLEREEIQKRQQEQMIKMYQDREDQEHIEKLQLQDKYHYLQQEYQIQYDKLEQNHITIQELYKQLNELQEDILVKDKDFDILKQQLYSQINQLKLVDIEQQKQKEMKDYIQSQTLQNQESLILKLKQENQMFALEAQNKENQIQLQHLQILEQKIHQIQKKNEIEKEKAIKEAIKPLVKDQVQMQKLLSEKNDTIRELRQEKSSFDQKCNEFIKQINKQKRQNKATVIKYEHIIKSLNERINYILQRKKTDSFKNIEGNQVNINGAKIFNQQQKLNSLRGRSSTITECFDNQNLFGSDLTKNLTKHIKISGINILKKGNAQIEEINYRNGANIKCIKLKIENKKAFNPHESIMSRNENINKESVHIKQKQNQRPLSSTNQFKETFLLNNQDFNLTNQLQQNKVSRSQSRQLNLNKSQNKSLNINSNFVRNKQNTMKLPRNLNYDGLGDLIETRQKDEIQSELNFEKDLSQQIYLFENCYTKNIKENQKNQDEDRELAFDLTQTNRESQERKHYNLNEYNFDIENKKSREFDYDAHNTLARNNQMQLSPQSNHNEFYFQNPKFNFEGNKISNYDQNFKQLLSLQNQFQNQHENNLQLDLKSLNVYPEIKINDILNTNNNLQQTQGSEQYQLINFPQLNNEQQQFNNQEIQNQYLQLDNKIYNHCECCKKYNQQCYKNYLQNFTNSLIQEKVNSDLYKETSNSFLIRKEITTETENGLIENRNIEQNLSVEKKNQEREKEQIKNNEQHPTYLISQLYPSSRTAKTVQTDGMQHTTNNSDLITGEYEIPKLNIQNDQLPLCSQRNEPISQLEILSVNKQQSQLSGHHTKTANIIANQDGQLFLIQNHQKRQKLHILNQDCEEYNQTDLEFENCQVESESKQTQNLSHRLSYENQIVRGKTLDLHQRQQQLEQIQSIKLNFKDITNFNAQTYNHNQLLNQSPVPSQTHLSPIKDFQIQNNSNIGSFNEQLKKHTKVINNQQIQKESISPQLKNNNQNKKQLNARKSESNYIKNIEYKYRIDIDENKNHQLNKNQKKKSYIENLKPINMFHKGKHQNEKTTKYQNHNEAKKNQNNYFRYQQFNQNQYAIPEFQEQILHDNIEYIQNPHTQLEKLNKNIMIEKLNKNNISQEDFSFQQPHGYYQNNESIQIRNNQQQLQNNQIDFQINNKQSESSHSSISQELCKIPVTNEYVGGSFGMQDSFINTFINQNKSKSVQQQYEQKQI